MSSLNLFDFDYSLDLPDQEKFPLNLKEQSRTVNNVLLQDIQNTEKYIILTGFTSLSNLIEVFGTQDYPKLKQLRIVIGFDPDERVSKKLPHYVLSTEIKNYWVKQNVSIKLCAPILNIIEKIKEDTFSFKVKDRLHAKIYVGDTAAILGSSNFSKSGTRIQTEANIRVQPTDSAIEKQQYDDIKSIAEYYYGIAQDYNQGIIDLFSKLLKDSMWEEALARAIAEILESKWIKDFPVLYQALISYNLWPSQKMGIARAMKIIQDQGRVLIADPTGSGKTKFSTALAYTISHWLWENGLKDRSSALIICPRPVIENWEREQIHFTVYNKIESMGKLSLGNDRNQKGLQRLIENANILVIDEAHNYLHPKSKRSQAITPKGSSHVILSTATPINKKANDLLRLVELLDIDNLSDDDLTTYLNLRKSKKKNIDKKHLEHLKGYINQFIVRRTKRELNKMIEREPEYYRNRHGKTCRYPKTISETYYTGESEADKEIAQQILILIQQLKGIHYLQELTIPDFLKKKEEKIQFISQRFTAAKALAGYMIRINLRSSCCALYEYLYGTAEANKKFSLNSSKNDSGNIIGTIKRHRTAVPKKYIIDDFLNADQQWLYDKINYSEACQQEIDVYEKIGSLIERLSGSRESRKADVLIKAAIDNNKILAFDSTVITLDYLNKIITEKQSKVKSIVAAGHNKTNRNLVLESFALGAVKEQKIIALCSDAMSEGINLQDASCLVLLDMPSVLRIIEQRIGRLERMDCEHEKITVLWPDDSEAFSLKGDKRMIDILLVTENLIGNNVEIPKNIYDKYLKEDFNTQNVINAFQEYVTTDQAWDGIKDSTQYLYSLIEGSEALIDHNIYEMYKDVDATVKTAVSFIESDTNWCFFAFRGSVTRSPKWLLIDENGNGHTEFSMITQQLKTYLRKDNIIQRKWSEVDTAEQMAKIIQKLRQQERNLLPWKKKRALERGKLILKKYLETKATAVNRIKCEKLIKLFDHDTDEEYIDLDHFADLWLRILIPELDKLKAIPTKRRKIYTLRDLNLQNVNITTEHLDWLLDNCQYATTLDEMISACIIGISNHIN